MKKLATVVLLLLALLVSSGAYAFSFLGRKADTAVVEVSLPFYARTSSEAQSTGVVQAVVIDGNIPKQPFDATEGYLGDFEVIDGRILRIYPNANTEKLGIIAMAASAGEPRKELTICKNKSGGWDFQTESGVWVMCRDSKGRFYLDFPIYQAGTDAYCIRFYALVSKGKRTDRSIDLLVLGISWSSKSDAKGFVDTARFKTVSKCSGPIAVNPVTLALPTPPAPNPCPTIQPAQACGTNQPSGQSQQGIDSKRIDALEQFARSATDAINQIVPVVTTNLAAVKVLERNQNKLADAVNTNDQCDAEHDARLDRLENWANKAAAPQPASTAPSNLSFEVVFVNGFGQPSWQQSLNGYTLHTTGLSIRQNSRQFTVVNGRSLFTEQAVGATKQFDFLSSTGWKTATFTVVSGMPFYVIPVGN